MLGGSLLPQVRVDMILSQVQVGLATAGEDIRAGTWRTARGRSRRALNVFHRLLGRSEQIQIIELLFRRE